MVANYLPPQMQPSPRACRYWGIAAGTVGLSSSALNGFYFYEGAKLLEGDSASRWALMATGALLVAAQLLAFAIASWLPTNVVKARKATLLILGTALLAFEIITTGVTQLALSQRTAMAAEGSESEAQELRRTIASLEQTITVLQANAAAQSHSVLADSRAKGGEALKEAVRQQELVEEKRQQLAALDKARRPTMQSLLGEERTQWLLIARSTFLAFVGLVLTSTAGGMFRLAREVATGRAGRREAPSQPAVAGTYTTQAMPAPQVRMTVQVLRSPPPTVDAEQGAASLEEGRDRSLPNALASKHDHATEVHSPRAAPRRTQQAVTRHLHLVAGADTAAAPNPAVPSQVQDVPAATQPGLNRACYPAVVFESARVTLRDSGQPRRVDCQVAIGLGQGAAPVILGVWIGNASDQAFWRNALTVFETGGIRHIDLAVAEDNECLHRELRSRYPRTKCQANVARLIEESLDHVRPRDRKAMAAALQSLLDKDTDQAAADGLTAISTSNLGRRNSEAIALLQKAWAAVTPMFASNAMARRIASDMATLSAIHHCMRRITEAHEIFAAPEELAKYIGLAIKDGELASTSGARAM